MDATMVLTRVFGPALFLRGISLVWNQAYYREVVDRLEQEVTSVAFLTLPGVLMVGGMALVLAPLDTSHPAGLVLRVAAWGALLKGVATMLCPRLMVKKARALVDLGFMNLAAVVCLLVGGYFSWVGFGPALGL